MTISLVTSHTKLVTGMTAASLRDDDESAGVAARKEVYREEKDAERPGREIKETLAA